MRKLSFKKRLGLLVALPIISLTGVAYAAVTFGPSRPTFTWANPADHVTFNSITDNPSWGDERHIMKSRDLTSPTTDYATTSQVKDGEDVVLAVYFHNDAATNLGLTATNTRVKFVLPGDSASTLTPTAYISADNAKPTEVWSTVDLTNSQPFTVSYEPGTAKLYSNYINSAGMQISDSVVGSGTLIGTNGPDGKVPGCAIFSGYVTIRVKVHVTPPPVSSFACTALGVTQIDKTRFDFTAHATVANATVNSYSFTVKNSNGQVVDTQTVTTSALSAVYHFNQSAAGTYTVSAVVNTDKGSTQPVAPCVAQATVTVTPPVTPPTTPETPKALPNTGVGDVFGLFAGASAAGTAAHVAFSARRNRRG